MSRPTHYRVGVVGYGVGNFGLASYLMILSARRQAEGHMDLSCCLWALADPPERALKQVADIGFNLVDVRPHTPVDVASERGLQISCVAASHEMPEGAVLYSNDALIRQRAYDHIVRALDYAAAVGAQTAYVVPEVSEVDAVEIYARTLTRLADHAATLGVRLCLEHFPGSPFPSIDATLEFLQFVDHANLSLLLDIGHAQISSEKSAPAITVAGDRLGYVHLADNDGIEDLHLALTDGLQTRTSIQEILTVLVETGYHGCISLELHPQLPDLLSALRRGRELVTVSWAAGGGGGGAGADGAWVVSSIRINRSAPGSQLTQGGGSFDW